MTLDFPPLSLSPPAYTLPGSGRPTVVPDGMPLPVPPAMWGPTSSEVHVVPPVVNPSERFVVGSLLMPFIISLLYEQNCNYFANCYQRGL